MASTKGYVTVKSGSSITIGKKTLRAGVHQVEGDQAKAFKAAAEQSDEFEFSTSDPGDKARAQNTERVSAKLDRTSTVVASPTKQQLNQAQYEREQYAKGLSDEGEKKPLSEAHGDFDPSKFDHKLAPTRPDGGGVFEHTPHGDAFYVATDGERAHQPVTGHSKAAEAAVAAGKDPEDKGKEPIPQGSPGNVPEPAEGKPSLPVTGEDKSNTSEDAGEAPEKPGESPDKSDDTDK